MDAEVNISVSPDTGLLMITIKRADGSLIPVVTDPNEARQVVLRLVNLADEAESAGDAAHKINLIAVLREVLGRDPLADN